MCRKPSLPDGKPMNRQKPSVPDGNWQQPFFASRPRSSVSPGDGPFECATRIKKTRDARVPARMHTLPARARARPNLRNCDGVVSAATAAPLPARGSCRAARGSCRAATAADRNPCGHAFCFRTAGCPGQLMCSSLFALFLILVLSALAWLPGRPAPRRSSSPRDASC